ncbi:hypothetical protein MKS88_001601 [Plasmodium brasilianum]|uniref:Uncharacterized protein n=1 Tax=Plasmodium brasilianum TaxID=5824 RepID=A0ACB9YDR4_PLABR|nr:hypothetical protein MKS88_001601 [Plasmodium brasilianum]
MYKKIKLLLFIKINAFLLLSWTFPFNNVNTSINFLNENYNLAGKLSKSNYRLLGKYKHDKDSSIVTLKEDTLNNRVRTKNHIYNDKKETKGKHKQSNRILLNKAQYYTEFIDYNNGMFDGKHFHFERKFMKKKDYDNFVEKKKRTRDIALKKIKFRSYGFGIATFLIFFLLGFGLPISYGYEMVKDATFTPFKSCWEFIYNNLGLKQIIEAIKSLVNQESGGGALSQAGVPGVEYFYIGIFCLLIIVLAIILIVTIPKILRNNEKYKKIKYMTQ